MIFGFLVFFNQWGLERYFFSPVTEQKSWSVDEGMDSPL